MFGIEADSIRAKQEQILCLWETRCLEEVTSARSSDSLALRNSLPLYLEHLSEALATNRRTDLRSVSLHDEESTRIGKLHGADRATNRSYTLNEVIVEYHILREVLFRVLEADGVLDAGDLSDTSGCAGAQVTGSMGMRKLTEVPSPTRERTLNVP